MVLTHFTDKRTAGHGLKDVTARLVLVALSFTLGGLCHAQQDYSKGILDIDTVRRAAASVTAEKYPNADDVLVDDHIIVRYEPDGRSVEWDDTVFKVLTEKGKRDGKTLSRHFTLPYGTASFKLVQVIKPDGRVVAVDVAKQSRVMVDRSQMSANIYNPNQKILQVGIPELEVGDMVRYVAFREITKPRVPNTWSDYQVLEYTSPIRRYVYEVQAPAALPLHNIALKSEIEGTVEYSRVQSEDGRTVHRWEARDVPRMYREPNMPALYTVVQRLLVSTITDWREISTWYWNLSEPHYEPTPEMRTRVKELVRGVTGREQQIKAIFKFVSQEVRYLGITVEKEAPGYEPHDVKLTFENRHGVCRDKAALLAVMLRLAGMKAFPVLIHNGPKKDAEVPQPFFNHAIAAVENDDGSYTLMDPTDENTKEMFPAYLCNQSYLVAKPAGETLLTSPIVPAESNLMRIATQAAIDRDGTLTGECLLDFEGINDNAYRGYFSRIKPEQRRRFFEGAVKRLVAGARLTDLRITPQDMLNTAEPLQVHVAYEADDVVVSDGEYAMLPVPRMGARVGMVNFILGKTGLKKRNYPLETDIACGVRETLDLKLDPSLGRVLKMPDYPTLEDDTIFWRRQLAASEGGLTGRSEFLLKAVEFSPDQYLALKDVLKSIEVNARKKPIFRRSEASPSASGEADVTMLSDVWDYTVTDAHSWSATRRVRLRILTYKGKKDYSELKWDYNPAWEEVRLVKATVTNGDVVKEISDQEINEMDASWVGSAPRYPAGKTLVASLPSVEVGSVVEYEYVRVKKDRPFFAMRHSFRGHDPIELKTVRLTVPAALPLRRAVFDHGTMAPTSKPGEQVIERGQRSAGDTLVYEWTVRDQPSVKPESGLPPWWAFNPTVFVSSGDWRDYAGRVQDAFTRAASEQPVVQALARKITADCATSRDRAIVIRDHVAKQIRSAGPGLHALPLTACCPADRTLADGYGNASDRAIVLFAMLEAAGLRPEFVLASWSPRQPDLQRPLIAYPALSLFNDVLVRVRVYGREVILNDTSQYAELGATRHDGRLGLSLSGLEPTPIRAASGCEDRGDVCVDVELAPNGDALVRKTVYYHGTMFGGMNRRFSEMPPEERRRYHLEALARISQSAEAEGALMTEFDAYPGVESFTARVKGLAVRDGEFLYLTSPTSLTGLLGTRADERTNPLYWAVPVRRRIVTTVTCPEEVSRVILAPALMNWQAPVGAGRVRVALTGVDGLADAPGAATLRLVHEAELAPAVIPAAAYPELLETDRRLGHMRARTLLLSTSKPE